MQANTQNEIQFQYLSGEPFVMRLYRVKGIERDSRCANETVSFTVKLAEEPQNSGIERCYRLPNMFMQEALRAFQDDEFILASVNNGIIDALIVISRPERFSLEDYLNNRKDN